MSHRNEKTGKGINTPYDSAFKSIIKKCPRMALFLINEMFYKTGLIDEEYDGTEKIELLSQELPDLEFGDLELDQRISVCKTEKRTFHLECQSTADGTMILRMIRYDTRTALDEAIYTSSFIHVKIDDSGLVFLRSTKNTPDIMTVFLEVPQGQSISYQIPVIRMMNYSLDYIIGHRLYMLLPFLFFNYERQLEKVSNDSTLFEEIQNLYNTIMDRLRELTDSEIISAFEANTLYEALKIIFEALGKTNKAEQEVADIMGGEILEFSADKYYYAGLADGIKKGWNDGRKEGWNDGRKEGEKKLAELIGFLLADGKTDEVARAVKDKDYRDSLYEKYSIL
ncbi:MAG: hypothetical protein K5989_05330 [Lachnospiraceae bacterium]|nr:hypothetical protein [Lachnospiraceae bacterium]